MLYIMYLLSEDNQGKIGLKTKVCCDWEGNVKLINDHSFNMNILSLQMSYAH